MLKNIWKQKFYLTRDFLRILLKFENVMNINFGIFNTFGTFVKFDNFSKLPNFESFVKFANYGNLGNPKF